MSDHAKLRGLAEAAKGDKGYSEDAKANSEFIGSANPKTVLELLDEVERLRKALEFYADPECYKPQDRYCPARGTAYLQSDVQTDNFGDKARKALTPTHNESPL